MIEVNEREMEKSGKVRIVQLLCPERHCIVATAYESPDGGELPEMAQRLQEYFADWVKAGANPWCGLCGSRTLHAEDGKTRFSTIAEAMPYLKELEQRQAATREFLKASRG